MSVKEVGQVAKTHLLIHCWAVCVIYNKEDYRFLWYGLSLPSEDGDACRLAREIEYSP